MTLYVPSFIHYALPYSFIAGGYYYLIRVIHILSKLIHLLIWFIYSFDQTIHRQLWGSRLKANQHWLTQPYASILTSSFTTLVVEYWHTTLAENLEGSLKANCAPPLQFLALLCATAQQSYCRHAGVRRPSVVSPSSVDIVFSDTTE